MASCGAAVARWDALPSEVVERVVSFLAGDVASLCAVLCVARAWRDAASEPRLWSRVAALPRTAVPRLTDAGLKKLIARAGEGFTRLDLYGGAPHLTDDGLVAALRQPNGITVFIAGQGSRLTAQCVARALAPRRGLLQELRLRGLHSGINDTGDYDLWLESTSELTGELHALMAHGREFCDSDFCSHLTDGLQCSVLCGPQDCCAACNDAFCVYDQEYNVDTCIDCERFFCKMGNCQVNVFGWCQRCEDEMERGERPQIRRRQRTPRRRR